MNTMLLRSRLPIAGKSSHKLFTLSALVWLCFALFFAITATHAGPDTVFNVDSTLDEPAAVVGVCVSTPSGKCTLRAAIQAANVLTDADTINLPAGIYTLTIAGTGENNAATGDLDIKNPLAIVGAGAETTIIDGGGLDRVFDVWIAPPGIFNISGVTIRHGNTFNAGFGGGLNNRGAVVVIANSIFVSNTTSPTTGSAQWAGGAIHNQSGGVLTVTFSSFLSNTASFGASINNDGRAYANNSAFENGVARLGAGGIDNQGDLTIVHGQFISNKTALFNNAAGTVLLNASTFTANQSTLFNYLGQITILNSIFTFNTDGTIVNEGSLTVDASTFLSNTSNLGGALYNRAGNLPASIRASTFAYNTALRSGGAIYNRSILSVTNSTFFRNDAITTTAGVGGGGAVLSAGVGPTGTTSILNSTFVSNTAGSSGGSIRVLTGTVTLKNSLVAFGGLDNCSGTVAGTFVSQGHNISSDTGCSLTATGDLTNTNPLVGPLQNNGGATLTVALLQGSPAIDAADDTGCPSTDQRGFARPQGPHCDIGAYEVPSNFVYLPAILR